MLNSNEQMDTVDTEDHRVHKEKAVTIQDTNFILSKEFVMSCLRMQASPQIKL
jgi:hypothetical protein